MKTIVMKMWLVVAAALTVTLTSCSDDDDNNKSGSGKMTYFAEIEVSDDVLSLATVNLQEYGNSGLGAATQLTKPSTTGRRPSLPIPPRWVWHLA